MLCLACVAGTVHSAYATPPNVIIAAEYTEPTSRYPHAVLGDAIEWGALRLTVDMCSGCENTDIRAFTIKLPKSRVFEDTAPRIVDLDGEGSPSVVVVDSDQSQGARLAIYNEAGLRAATPFIGTRFRWLAPVAIADLDQDGAVELAYVDRPHLAKTLRIWRFNPDDNSLSPIAQLPGVTNHRIGEPDIAGGLRTCAGAPEMIVANAHWSRLIAARLTAGRITTQDIGPHTGRASFQAALNCE